MTSSIVDTVILPGKEGDFGTQELLKIQAAGSSSTVGTGGTASSIGCATTCWSSVGTGGTAG